MKRLFLFTSFLFLFYSLYSQEKLRQYDLLFIKQDTIKCRIIEVEKNGVTFLLQEKNARQKSLLSDYSDKEIVFREWKRNEYIQFYQDPKALHSTQELIGKFDFSHRKFLNSYIYEGGIAVQKIDTNNNRIFWLGLDFSKIRIKLGIAPRAQYTEPFLKDCNDFILSEKGMFGFFYHFNFIIDTGIVSNRNNRINFPAIYNRPGNTLPLDSIRSMLKEMNFLHDGIGFIIFVTEMNKETESITFYPTFFDLQTKTILLCLKETGEAGGVGMAHHWTRPIVEFSENLIKKDNWKKRYLKD